MADYCVFCETRRPEGGTKCLILGKEWLEFCEPCGKTETLTNHETGQVLPIAEVFELVKDERETENA